MEKLTINEAGIQQGAIFIAWQEIRGLKKSIFSSYLKIQGNSKCIFLDPKVEGAKEDFLSFYRTWQKFDASAAKKSAFDYIEDHSSFIKLQIVISFIFCLGVAVLCLSDSLPQAHCTKMLETSAQTGTATVSSTKRKRFGHYLVKFDFRSISGRLILGEGQYFSKTDTPPKTDLPIVYNPEEPECWSFTEEDNPSQPQWAQRRFFTSFTSILGIMFGVIGLLGIALGFAKLSEKRPFTSELKNLFGLEI